MPTFPLGGGVPKGTLGPVNGGNGPVCVTVTAGVEPAVIASLTVGITVVPTLWDFVIVWRIRHLFPSSGSIVIVSVYSTTSQ